THLERLLAENQRDSQLLHQLSTLAENEGDIAAATKYQQQLARQSPNKENDTRLAVLLAKGGELEEAGAIWTRLTLNEQDPHKVLQSLDSLAGNNKFDTALAVTERMLRDKPQNWEALYREGVALAELNKPAEAGRRFRALLQIH